MALVTFTDNMRQGLRLQDFFTAVVGSISYGEEDELKMATFQVNVDHTILDIVYRGPSIGETSGRVSSLEVRRSGETLLTYASGSVLFAYDGGLKEFHAGGAAAAASIMWGSDQLNGSANGDYLEGHAGNDYLNGGPGADTLDGGAGNDTYIVDNTDDRVLEAVGGGYDVILTSVNFALAADSEVEELRAASGANPLSLIGNDFSNLIVGTSGNDSLDGKGGVDILIGGAGDDLYFVDSFFDVVVEEAGQGYDTVIAYASYALGDNIEVLKAAGGDLPISLTGNALSNEIFGNAGANVIDGRDGDDRLYGDGGNDVISGGSGQDVLYGGMGDDLLSGGEGNDHLFGDVGNDTLDGGDGNDALYGGTGRNLLLGLGGNDTLYGGMHADTLLGGDGNDSLYGDVGNDSLDGGPGNDTLNGGWGRDVFIFKDKLNAKTNVDTIKDFDVKDDTIRLENGIFKKLGKAGKLKPDFFTIASKAQDKNDYLIYNKKTGYLYYDADGSGSKSKAVVFSKLKSGLAMTDKDFYII
ncbi:calcium-binding protein [Microvirga lotononidis]|uniref:Ca2+-binding protein, RTX toxin n=1 Tax=Microvirga lotononidis TaxID=864069 RepID=I4YL09_9HYPH|nr:calcium-binding protein [Microvirga lotononidis]EIM24651.1 Ca2+-binding protein, RTX toxin [Microvirga lotononidis]WQO26665.1 calcium-binding protein [Microvirga lotononidis]